MLRYNYIRTPYIIQPLKLDQKISSNWNHVCQHYRRQGSTILVLQIEHKITMGTCWYGLCWCSVKCRWLHQSPLATNSIVLDSKSASSITTNNLFHRPRLQPLQQFHGQPHHRLLPRLRQLHSFSLHSGTRRLFCSARLPLSCTFALHFAPTVLQHRQPLFHDFLHSGTQHMFVSHYYEQVTTCFVLLPCVQQFHRPSKF